MPIAWQIVTAYVLISVLTAVAAIMFVGRLGAAPPEAGYFLELNAISAVVIGGASLYGGSGTVPGVLLGALLMQSLSNGLSLMNVQSAYQHITSGLVLILAVYLDAVSKRGKGAIPSAVGKRSPARALGAAAMALGYAALVVSGTWGRVLARLLPTRGWRTLAIGDLVVRVPPDWGDPEPDVGGNYVVHSRPVSRGRGSMAMRSGTPRRWNSAFAGSLGPPARRPRR